MAVTRVDDARRTALRRVLEARPVVAVPNHAPFAQVGPASVRGDGVALIFGSAVGLGSSLRDADGSMPIIGAGCMGFVNVARGLRALGYVEREVLEPGPIALLTHS